MYPFIMKTNPVLCPCMLLLISLFGKTPIMEKFVAESDTAHTALVHLIYAGSSRNGVNYQLTINSVKVLADNPIVNGT